MASSIRLKNDSSTEFEIVHEDGSSAKRLASADMTVAVDTIADFPVIASDGDVVIVRDLNRGGTFIYDSAEVASSNEGTNFSGWIRQYDGAVNVEWFTNIGDYHKVEASITRYQIDDSGNFYVDSAYGLDSNDGTASSPFKTFDKLVDVINVSELSTIVAILRSGIYEITEGKEFTKSGDITIKSNNGENVVLCPKLNYVKKDSYGKASIVKEVQHLYKLDDESKVNITSSSLKSTFRRNQNAEITVSADIATLTPDIDILTHINNSNNLSKALIKVTQSWSMSLYKGLTVNGSDINYSIPSGQSTYYYNGYYSGLNTGFAPFEINNLSALKTPDTYYYDDISVYLPNDADYFFYPDNTSNLLTINGTGYTFVGLSFKWFSALDSNRVLDYTGTSMDSIAMLLVKSSNFTVTESNFLNVMGTAVYSKSANTNIVSNNFSYIGRDAIFIGDEAAPNTITPVYILQNNIERWGEYSASGRAITVYGDNVSIKDNTIKNGTSQAIQTAGNDTHNLTFNIFRNVIYNCGMPEGVKTDKYCLNDAGALYHNGLGVTGAVCNYLALQNVIFNVDGFKNVHGAYMDNGNNGISFKENLVFSCRTYSFYNRDESSTTKNSDVRDNILHGSYSCQDVSGGTFSNNFISARGGEAQNYLGGGITFVEYSGDLYSNSYTKENVLYVSNIENMRTNGLPVERYPINGYIKGIEYHSYNSNTSYNEINKAFIPNTLEKGTIINRGANGDSEFIKFSDGTLICGTYGLAVSPTNILSNQFGTTAGDVYSAESSIVFGHEFISAPIIVGNVPSGNALSIFYYSATTTGADYRVTSKTSAAITNISYIAVGRWK